MNILLQILDDGHTSERPTDGLSAPKNTAHYNDQ